MVSLWIVKHAVNDHVFVSVFRLMLLVSFVLFRAEYFLIIDFFVLYLLIAIEIL